MNWKYERTTEIRACDFSPDLLARQLRLQQQAQSAAKDLETANQPLQGQMVSGHYVAPSWTQYLGQALQQFDASNRLDKLPDQYAELQGLQQQGDMAKFGLGASPQAPCCRAERRVANAASVPWGSSALHDGIPSHGAGGLFQRLLRTTTS